MHSIHYTPSCVHASLMVSAAADKAFSATHGAMRLTHRNVKPGFDVQPLPLTACSAIQTWNIRHKAVDYKHANTAHMNHAYKQLL